MQINCTICGRHGNLWQDLEGICVTKCGHIFHLNCLKSQISLQPKSMIKCPTSICSKKIKQANIIQFDLTVIEKWKDKQQINEPVDCFLCNDPVTDPKNISVTKCGHIYHFNCLAAFVRPKANACYVPSCKKRITHATITQIHPAQGASDVTQSHQALTQEELLDLLDDTEDTCPPNNDSRKTLVDSCKKITRAQIHPVPSERVNVKPECSKAASAQLPPLLQDKKALCGQNNDQFTQQIKLDLERECVMNMLDEHSKLKNNEITLNQKSEELKHKNKALHEQMEALEKDRNEAEKEKAIWEMCFKYLQENFKDTELMIPNENTLSLMKENEKLKVYSQELERERNDAKKETAIWEMSFVHLQDKFKDTDMMIPNERTLELIKENETLKMCIQELGRELVSTKKDVKSAESLRADFENYLEENLNLKNENEEMKRDLKSVKEDMTKLDSTITDIVLRHSQENDTLNEFSDTLLEENTRLTEQNENLQKENNKLNEINNTQQKDYNKLHEINDTLQKDNNKLNETLSDSNKLNEPNHSLLTENIRLDELNDTLKKENIKLNESNQSLLKENTRLNELNETLKKEKIKYNELVLALQKEKRDFKWGLISRRRPCSDGFHVTTKRRASEIWPSATEKEAVTDLVYKKDIQEEVLNKEAIIEMAKNKEGIKEEEIVEEVVNKERIKKETENEEPDMKRIKLEVRH